MLRLTTLSQWQIMATVAVVSLAPKEEAAAARLAWARGMVWLLLRPRAWRRVGPAVQFDARGNERMIVGTQSWTKATSAGPRLGGVWKQDEVAERSGDEATLEAVQEAEEKAGGEVVGGVTGTGRRIRQSRCRWWSWCRLERGGAEDGKDERWGNI